MHEILSLLGLCFRAGKLVSGDDAVADSVSAGEARLLVLAGDAGANITRRVQRHEQEKGVPVLRLEDSAQELGWALGRKPTAICDIPELLAFIRTYRGRLALGNYLKLNKKLG